MQMLSLGSCPAMQAHALKASQRSDRFAVTFFSDQLLEKHK